MRSEIKLISVKTEKINNAVRISDILKYPIIYVVLLYNEKYEYFRTKLANKYNPIKDIAEYPFSKNPAPPPRNPEKSSLRRMPTLKL